MPPDSSDGHQLRRAAQADRVELHQHQVADQLVGQVGVLAQRERDVLEHRQVGEQRAELEQHADLAAQREQRRRGRGRGTDWPATQHACRRCGRSCPPMRRRIVVLPQPEPPMIATTLPRGIVMSMPRSTGRAAVVAERHVGQLDGVLGRTGGRGGGRGVLRRSRGGSRTMGDGDCSLCVAAAAMTRGQLRFGQRTRLGASRRVSACSRRCSASSEALGPAEQHDDVARLEAPVGVRALRARAAPAHAGHLDQRRRARVSPSVRPTARARSGSTTECSRGCRLSAASAASVAPWKKPRKRP